MFAELLITRTMLERAKDNKCTGWLYIHPLDFLKLTITSSNVFSWIKQEEDDTKSLSEYNGFAKSGKSSLMPWLDVDILTGKVLGHEGRHRAVALYTAGGIEFPVAICLRDRGYALYYEEVQNGPNHWNVKKVYMTKERVPKVLVGQFVHREVPIATGTMVEFWKGA